MNIKTQFTGAICPIIKILFIPTFMLISLTLLSGNLVLWWRILILTTLVFLTAVKTNIESYRIIKYFIIQEAASLTIGVIILFSIPLFLIRILIIIKVALAPFHFWVVSALQSLQGWPFAWVVTFQKIPGILILSQIINNLIYIILIIGSIICSIQMIVTVKPKTIVLLSTTVTSRWVVITIYDTISNMIFLTFYFTRIALLLNERLREQGINVEYLFILVLLSFPLTIIFIFKVAILLSVVNYNAPLLLIFLLSTLGASLAYMEILKNYVTTRETHFKLSRNKIFLILGPLLTLVIIF